jgi:hypothetical protein
MNLPRLRELLKAWQCGSIQEAELLELRDALPEVLAKFDRFALVVQAEDELQKCCEAWQKRMVEVDRLGIDHLADPQTNALDALWAVARTAYSQTVYDLFGPCDPDLCVPKERERHERRLLFWLDRL